MLVSGWKGVLVAVMVVDGCWVAADGALCDEQDTSWSDRNSTRKIRMFFALGEETIAELYTRKEERMGFLLARASAGEMGGEAWISPSPGLSLKGEEK
jgi:hypothetical protein